MKNLLLNPQVEINGYLFLVFPYSILYTFPEYKDYLMEHYIQCFGYINNSNCITYRYADGIDYNVNNMADPLDIIVHSYVVGLQIDIKNYIISSIDNNNYIVIFVDEYYIENRPAYQTYHRLHEILIYGYDDERFNYMTFDRRLYSSSFQQNQIDDAYRSGYSIYAKMARHEKAEMNWINEKSIILFKPKPIQNQYTFSSMRFIESLKSYLEGEFSASYNSFVISKERCYIGVYNTKLIKYFVDNPSENIYILYPSVHAWCESKRSLLNKIKYCYEKVSLTNSKLILDYESKVERQSNKIRLSLLKYQESSKLNRDAISLILNDIFNSEVNIINSIYYELMILKKGHV